MLRSRPRTSAAVMLNGMYCDGSDAPAMKCMTHCRDVLSAVVRRIVQHGVQRGSDLVYLSVSTTMKLSPPLGVLDDVETPNQ